MPRHVLALPFPGRGDINPVMDLCRSVVSHSDDIYVTLAVTEDWVSVFSGETPRRISVVCLEVEVILSELAKAGDFRGFIEAVLTKMEAPLEKLLDGLDEPPCLLVADTFLLGAAVRVSDRRDIPVAAFWPTSAAMFTLYRHLHLLEQNDHYNLDLSAANDVTVNYVPGLTPTNLREILGIFHGLHDYILPKFREAFSLISRTQCVLLSSIYELEQQTLDDLRAIITTPLLTIASSMNNVDETTSHDEQDYIKWLNDRPENSVLYIAFGSHVPVSPQQMDEIITGLSESDVNFLLVTRSLANELREACGDKGFVVPWCDQIRVLSHRSIGAFWSHCGWNSTKEGVFAGVPFLTFPFYGDQILISKLIVEDWKSGVKVKENVDDDIVGIQRIANIVRKIMDSNHPDSIGIRKRAKEIQDKVLEAVSENGSLEKSIDAFVNVIYSL